MTTDATPAPVVPQPPTSTPLPGLPATPPAGDSSTTVPGQVAGVADAAVTILSAIKPGWQTSEAKVTTIAGTAITAAYAAFMFLLGAHDIPAANDSWAGAATAIEGVLLSALAGNYTYQRTALKKAALNASSFTGGQ